MSTIDSFLKEAMDSLTVAKDLGIQMNKDDAEMAAQALLAHAIEVVMVAKSIATPHKIAITFLSTTLRYPEDCAAGYQLTDEFRTTYPLIATRADYVIDPKFLGDIIWNSSDNCSDQGLDMFDAYNDFALTCDDRWKAP